MKYLRSSVTISLTPSRSASAITEASVVPSRKSWPALDQISDSQVVLRREVGDLVVAVRDRTMKRCLGSTPQLGVQKMADLSYNRFRDEEPPSSQAEPVTTPRRHDDSRHR
ncbi:MAG: hypothetical protein R2742_08445 [Micropruina glycogenica]